MIHPLVGNIFESKAQTLVNTVNCVGIMGKGLALEFKKLFPDMYEDYVARCKANKVRLGEPYLYRRLLSPWILNFPTKDHWRSVSRLSDIVAGLEYLEKHYHEWEITSLAVPALGCSNGQLEWRVVGPTLYRYLSRLDIPVELYAPYGTFSKGERKIEPSLCMSRGNPRTHRARTIPLACRQSHLSEDCLFCYCIGTANWFTL